MLSEKSKSQNGKYCMILLWAHEVPRRVKFRERESRMAAAKGLGGGENEELINGCGG